MNRREFITGIAGGSAAAFLMPASGALRTLAQGHATGSAKFNRICISTWSFHNYFQSTRDQDFKLPGKMLAMLDFPEMIADRYKVHNVELDSAHFASTEPTYLQELKSRLLKSHTHLINMPIDIEEFDTGGGLSDPDAKVRNKGIEAAKKWVDIGKQLGTRSIRCDPGKINPDDLSATIDSYKQISLYGKSKGVRVLIENHGGVGSEHPEELVKLFQGVGNPFIGALPDFGNFPDEATREKGLPVLFPYAPVVCHAKGIEFDANGNETTFNFANCMAAAKKAGYRGIYSIEYEGKADPYMGVQKVVDELVRYL